MDRQHQVLCDLQDAVRNTAAFASAKNADRLIRLPTGDGMALVFFDDPEAPVQCATDLARLLRPRTDIGLRMGIHTGPVYRVADINANRNVAGGGINIAQRVMDCGDARHILVSGTGAEILGQLSAWSTMLHDLGEVEVKHGVRLHLYNLCNSEIGNCEVPTKLRRASRMRKSNRWLIGFAALLLVLGIGLGLRLVRWHTIPGLNERQLTHNSSENSLVAAAISPDGKYLAFADSKDLQLMQIDSGESHNIALPDEMRTSIQGVGWFSDGQQLLIETWREADGPTIWAESIFGGPPRRLREHASSA